MATSRSPGVLTTLSPTHRGFPEMLAFPPPRELIKGPLRLTSCPSFSATLCPQTTFLGFQLVASILAFQNLGNIYLFLSHPEANLTLKTSVRGNKSTKDIKRSWDLRMNLS